MAGTTGAARLDEDELDLWKAFIRVGQLLPAALDEALGRAGESLPRFEILAALSTRRDGLRVSELGRLALVSKPRMSVHLADLEAAGLVERHPDPEDGRASIVSITSAGRRRLAGLTSGHVAEARRLVIDRIDPAHRPYVLDALAEVLAALGDSWRPGEGRTAVTARRTGRGPSS